MCLMEEHMGLQQLHDNPDKNKKKKRRVSNPTGDGEHASMSDPVRDFCGTELEVVCIAA